MSTESIQRSDGSPCYRGPVTAIVADWAGTTIDYGSRAPAFVFQEVFRRREVEVTVAEAREPMGMAKREHIAAVSQMPKVDAQWRQRYGSSATDADIEAMYEQFIPLQKEVLHQHSDLIPGTVETIEACRSAGLKIGSSTGYTKELMEVVLAAAKRQGYEPDCMVCSDDIDFGRPAPWMLLTAAQRMGVYPLRSIVKVDDTTVGIEAGRNAGAWTVGIAATGNEMGLSLEEYEALSDDERARRLDKARSRFLEVGAHYVIDSIEQLPTIVEEINVRLAKGECL